MNCRAIGTLALVSLCGLASAQTSPAEFLGEIDLFGSTYEVRRVSINEITFDDPVNPGITIPMGETEGFHYLGGNRVVMSTDAGDNLGSARTLIIEAEILTDGNGVFTGMDFVRLVAAEDNTIPFGNGTFDLNASGLTVAPVPGLGDRLFQSSGDEEVFVWDHLAGTLPIPLVLGPVSLSPNTDSEDIEYVPAVNQFFTVLQDSPNFSIIRFEAGFGPFAMNPIDAPGDIPVGESGVQSGAGAPKGIFDVPDGPNAPADFQGLGGVVVVTLDDEGPGLEAYQYDGTPAGFETLTENGNPSADPIPQFDITSFCLNFGDPPTLQIECGGYDTDTGRFFIVNQGEDDVCAFMYVLEPVETACPADLAGGPDGEPDGVLDANDFFAYLGLFAAGDAAADLAGGPDGGPDGVIDANDFFTYLGLFSDGCP